MRHDESGCTVYAPPIIGHARLEPGRLARDVLDGRPLVPPRGVDRRLVPERAREHLLRDADRVARGGGGDTPSLSSSDMVKMVSHDPSPARTASYQPNQVARRAGLAGSCQGGGKYSCSRETASIRAASRPTGPSRDARAAADLIRGVRLAPGRSAEHGPDLSSSSRPIERSPLPEKYLP